MTYEEFISEIKLVVSVRRMGFKKSKWQSGKGTLVDLYVDSLYSHKIDEIKYEDCGNYIQVETCVGGIRGNSCWGGESEGYVNSEPVEDLTELDKLFEIYCPEISFLKYKKFVNENVENFSREESEYYGNSSNYIGKRLNLKTLYDFLIESKCLM